MVADCCHLVVFLLRIMGTSFNMAISLSVALKRPVRLDEIQNTQIFGWPQAIFDGHLVTA
jgi:hypothetical protein